MNTLKQDITKIVQENIEDIRIEQQRGNELLTLTCDWKIVFDFSDNELSGTTMEKDESVEQMIDSLYFVTIAKKITQTVGPEVEAAWKNKDFKSLALSNILQDLAVNIIDAKYDRTIVELVVGEEIPIWLCAEDSYGDAIALSDTFIQAIFIHNAPVPQAKTRFSIPKLEDMDTNGWWLANGHA